MAYDESGLLSLPVVAARLARGRDVVTRADYRADASAWIDYPGPPGTIRTVSFVDVERGRVDPTLFKGKVVVVGATAQSLKDVFASAASPPTPSRARPSASTRCCTRAATSRLRSASG